jgi:hypothetical protein
MTIEERIARARELHAAIALAPVISQHLAVRRYQEFASTNLPAFADALEEAVDRLTEIASGEFNEINQIEIACAALAAIESKLSKTV